MKSTDTLWICCRFPCGLQLESQHLQTNGNNIILLQILLQKRCGPQLQIFNTFLFFLSNPIINTKYPQWQICTICLCRFTCEKFAAFPTPRVMKRRLKASAAPWALQTRSDSMCMYTWSFHKDFQGCV